MQYVRIYVFMCCMCVLGLAPRPMAGFLPCLDDQDRPLLGCDSINLSQGCLYICTCIAYPIQSIISHAITIALTILCLIFSVCACLCRSLSNSSIPFDKSSLPFCHAHLLPVLVLCHKFESYWPHTLVGFRAALHRLPFRNCVENCTFSSTQPKIIVSNLFV